MDTSAWTKTTSSIVEVCSPAKYHWDKWRKTTCSPPSCCCYITETNFISYILWQTLKVDGTNTRYFSLLSVVRLRLRWGKVTYSMANMRWSKSHCEKSSHSQWSRRLCECVFFHKMYVVTFSKIKYRWTLFSFTRPQLQNSLYLQHIFQMITRC